MYHVPLATGICFLGKDVIHRSLQRTYRIILTNGGEDGMVGLRQAQLVQREWVQAQTSLPIGVGILMVLTSFLPWLKDPLGNAYIAWNLPLELGWWVGLPTALTRLLNYGLLCTLCALYLIFVGYVAVKPFRWYAYFANRYTFSAFVCVVPLLIFCLQYLIIDMPFMAHLAQRETQLLLIQHHFGYHSATQRIAINPLTLDISSLQARFVLLYDQASFGILGPCFSCWLLLEYRRRYSLSQPEPLCGNRKRSFIIGAVGLLLLFGRAPFGMFCETQANGALEAGNYVSALQWLDAAQVFNPLLNDVAFFHRERGQALYFLHNNDEQNDDTRVYLAFEYRNQGNLFDAYQQLLVSWKTHHTLSWTNEDLALTLEMLAESKKPLKVQPHIALATEESALQWLQILNEVDASNVYSRYSTGRINYELQDYKGCTIQMQRVLSMSTNPEIQSSGYTYVGLSEEGQGYYALSRALLLRAVKLDPYYRNNVAREELSGLR